MSCSLNCTELTVLQMVLQTKGVSKAMKESNDLEQLHLI